MKKILSILLAALFVASLSLTAFAAMPDDNPVRGASKEIKKTVQKTVVEGYLCTDAAKEVFDIVNQERASVGVAPLKWNDKLNSAAQLRAMEQYVSPSHTRPDGSHFSTVNSLVNNENLAGGTHPDLFTASGIMDGWMNSTGHRETLLNPAYVSMSVACVYTDQGIYWAQVFSRTPVDGDTAVATPVVTTTAPAKTTTPAKATTQGDFTVSIKSSDGTIASQKTDVLTAADMKTYGTKNYTLYADTTVGKSLQGRLQVVPKSLAGRQTDYKLGVYTSNSNITSISDKFTKAFKNKLVVVQIEEKDLGVSTHVIVKVNLEGFNTKNLTFYTYSSTENKYYPITNPQYSVDDKGFLHFYTSVGEYILISDGSLTK